jgi:hypothetical protein
MNGFISRQNDVAEKQEYYVSQVVGVILGKKVKIIDSTFAYRDSALKSLDLRTRL